MKILIVKQILFVSTFKMYGEQYGEFKGAEGWNYIYFILYLQQVLLL